MLIITEMEYIGVSINKDELKKQSESLSKRINKIESDIYQYQAESSILVHRNKFRKYSMMSSNCLS